MRYTNDHKLQTRKRILSVAATLFKTNGLSNVGIAEIMQSAGLTNGAFYAHFPSKMALVETVIQEELDTQLKTFDNAAENDAGVRFIINSYLSMEHRNNCAGGCPSAALIGDVTKLDVKAKTIYKSGIQDIARELATRISQSDQALTYGIYGLMLGTLQLARSVADESEAEKILQSGRQAALRLVGI